MAEAKKRTTTRKKKVAETPPPGDAVQAAQETEELRALASEHPTGSDVPAEAPSAPPPPEPQDSVAEAGSGLRDGTGGVSSPTGVSEAAASSQRVLPERIVVFTLEGQSYALPIDRVQEIQQLVALSPVPDPSPALLGMVNLRGEVIPAIDLRAMLGMPSARFGLDTTMIISNANGHPVALVVDGVEDVLELPPDCVQEPSRLHTLAQRMIGVCRMGERLVYLLDIDNVVPLGALGEAPTVGGEA